mmetsp:Transcript_10272/g.22035  ORF Transcript_10272/g.22035 Transcript_10272/m.22035 type:complete len:310 (-) Transcript_10272:367-1296(-)
MSALTRRSVHYLSQHGRFLCGCVQQLAEGAVSTSAPSASTSLTTHLGTRSDMRAVREHHNATLPSFGPHSCNLNLIPVPDMAMGSFAAAGQRRGMFIQTQPTPNPQSLMFQPGKPVMENGIHEFPNARAGMSSPLAKRLFTIDGVTSVFFGADFITVTKKDDANWAVLKPSVFAAIMDHYSSGEPLFLDAEAAGRSDTAIHEDDDEVVAMIKELLETRIRPAVQEDGGDIVYRGFDPDTGVVTVKMMGACSGCPSSTVTLKSGIENMLMHYIPEVKGVIEADSEEEEGGECASGSSAAKPNPLEQHLSA